MAFLVWTVAGFDIQIAAARGNMTDLHSSILPGVSAQLGYDIVQLAAPEPGPGENRSIDIDPRVGSLQLEDGLSSSSWV